MRHLLTLAIIMMTLTACAPPNPLLGNPEQPYSPAREPQVGDILHLPTGIYVGQQTMTDHAVRNRVVFVGETHDNPASHRLQEDILQALWRNNPGNVTLAMEMFNPGQQATLDRWSAGDLTEKEFLKEVDWYNTWRMNFAYYRPLLDFCKKHRIPVLALNAEPELKQQVSRTPLQELPEQVRKKLPEMDEDPYQQAMVEAIFQDHGMGQAMLDGFQRVQTLWDETMARNLAAYLKSKEESHQVMVVAGGNHIRYGYGIPRRMFRRVPASYLLIGSSEIDIPEDKQDRLMDVRKPEYPMPPYHFIKFTRYEDLPSSGVKLGVSFDVGDTGIVVQGVMPGSAAAEADIRENDIIIGIDDRKITEAFDLIYELQQIQVGGSVEITLLRNGVQQKKPIQFSETNQRTHGMK